MLLEPLITKNNSKTTIFLFIFIEVALTIFSAFD